MTLIEALEAIDLEPGRIYRCQIRGMSVELRVDSEDIVSETGSVESTVIEDAPMPAWFEIPSPEPISIIRPVFQPLPMPVPIK